MNNVKTNKDARAILLNELTARDSHQSLLATRMRNVDVLDTVRLNVKLGFNAMEVWGGATFDVAMRFLGENPWENLRNIKDAVKKSASEAGVPETPLMMLLRGQSVIGYKNYPDDVVQSFVRRAAENGMNIFRCFDGLNDTRNLQTAIDAVKQCQHEGMKVEAQGVICYTIGPEDKEASTDASALQKQHVFNLDYYTAKARELKEMGCDTICIKDMAGLMKPDVAADLIPVIQRETGLQVTLHMHAGMGLSDATLMSAIKSGVDVIDVGNAGLASGSGHSSAQMIMDMMSRSNDPEIKARIPRMDKSILKQVRETLLRVRPKYSKWETPYNPQMQQKTYHAQIPGGMLSNFEGQIKNQIKGMDGVEFDDVLGKVLDEVPRVRDDLGWPPLVTPCSQIVGVQAVLNVLGELRGEDRYTQMPEGTQKMLLGELGTTPAPANEALIALAEQRTKTQRITERPADHLKDGLPEALALMAQNDLSSNDIEDIMIVALWDNLGLDYLKNKETPHSMASYESEPQLPTHRTIRSSKEGVVAFGDLHDAIGDHVLEAIAQTAKEIGRLKNGFFQFLPQEELDYRLMKYKGYIDRQLFEIPRRLYTAGFEKYQIELLLVSSPVHSFNSIVMERCEALGVKRENIPQISLDDVRTAFDKSEDLNKEIEAA